MRVVAPQDAPSPAAPAEEGASIARSGPEADFLRQRMERPARVGRYVLTLLGAVTASAGVAFRIESGSIAGLAIGAFGAVLLVLGIVQHYLHKRDLNHWPSDVILWHEGVELVLPNGEVRGATWSDSDLALELVSRRAPDPAKREFLLLWLPDPKIPPIQLSEEGYTMLAKTAADGGLSISPRRRGSRGDSLQVIEIRAVTPSPITEVKKNANAEV